MESAMRKAARRLRIWLRRIGLPLRREGEGLRGGAVERLAAIGAPTADIDQMLREIAAGRGPERPQR